MALILGQSMIVRTLQQASKVKAFSKVICATEDLEIYELVKAHGFEAILTPNTFLTGSDRVAWVTDQLALEWVINLQGDEPLIDIDLLEEMALTLPKNKNCWLTSACPLLPEWENLASVVKVKVSESGDVLAFARENQKKEEWYRHTGVYGYHANQLHLFKKTSPSVEELQNSLEQLRVFPKTPIKVVLHQKLSHSVDVPGDIERVEEYLKELAAK
jgi:3-deoxy-manno-octulosonate cytidylyltransferase (CMP-KDO synthetase)